MMRKYYFCLFLCVCLLGRAAILTKPSGVNSNEVYGIAVVAANNAITPTNGVTAAQAETINRNSDSSGTNVFAGEAYGLTNLNYLALKQKAWDDWSLNCENIPKIKYQLGQKAALKLLVFSDDAIIGSLQFHAAMLRTLKQTMNRGGSLGVGGTYNYLEGDGSGYVIQAGSGTTEFFQTGWVGFGSGTEIMTNKSDTLQAIPTMFLTVSCALLNGGGTYTVSTQSLVNGVYGTKGTAFSFSADNGGSPAPFVTNFYLGGEFPVVASIQSSGGTTNILQSLGQWTTNSTTFVYDIWDIGGMEWITAMTNQFQSNHIAMVATNYDAIIVADAGYVYLGAPYANALWQAKNLTADIVYLGINFATNQSYSVAADARIAYATMATNGRPYIDVGSIFWASFYGASNSIVHSYYTDAAHVTSVGGQLTANVVTRKLGLTPSDLVSYGYQPINTGVNYYQISPFNSHMMVSGTINNTAPQWVDSFYSSYGSRFMACYFLPTASRQFAANIPSELMLGRKTIALRQYWMTTNSQIISAKSKFYKISSLGGTAGADIGSTAGSYSQTESGNVLFTTSITNSFTYPGQSGDMYSAVIGWGDSGTITNGLWWLGADVWMY